MLLHFFLLLHFLFLFSVYMNVCVGGVYVFIWAHMCVVIKGQFFRVNSLLSPCGFPDSNSSCPAQWQASLPIELFYLPHFISFLSLLSFRYINLYVDDLISTPFHSFVESEITPKQKFHLHFHKFLQSFLCSQILFHCSFH